MTDKIAIADQLDREVARNAALGDLAAEVRAIGGIEALATEAQKKLDGLLAQQAEVQQAITEHQTADKTLMDTLATRRKAVEDECTTLRADADKYAAAKRADADQAAVNARNEADRIVSKATSDANALMSKAREAIANFSRVTESAV